MRLGQLARKLEIKTSDIVNLLKEHDIEINDHPNVKIEGERESIVVSVFGSIEEKTPEPVDQIEVTLPVEDNSKEAIISEVKSLIEEESINVEQKTTIDHSENVDKENVDEIEYNSVEVEINTEKHPNIAQEPISEKQEEQNETEVVSDEGNIAEPTKPINEITSDNLVYEGDLSYLENIEVIRAPKVELEGLKVVGKIDLPEPKVNETLEEEKEAKREKKNQKTKRRTLSEEEREAQRLRNRQTIKRRLEREQAKEKKNREEQERLAKQEHYKQKLAADAKARKVKKANKKKATSVHVNKPQQPVPKSLLGKFWRWLNT